MMARSSPGGAINISATTKKVDVDNRISLLFYYRIADNILKQADIFREENNIVDLYVMLLRFSSLVTETIPCHRDYRTSPQGNKLYLKRKLISALTELEELKPAVQAKLQELHNKKIYQLNKQQKWQNGTLEFSVQQPAFKQNWNDYSSEKSLQPVTRKFGYQAPRTPLLTKSVEAHAHSISLSIPRPKEETLSKHSILGPNGLRAQWQPPSNHKVQYPSTVDFTPLQIPRDSNIQLSVNDVTMKREDDCGSERERQSLESAVQLKNDNQLIQEPESLISFEPDNQPIQEPDSLVSFEPVQSSSQTEIIRQPSPHPVLAEVQDLIPTTTPATQTESGGLENTSSDALVCTEDPLQLHISTELMNTFMKLAKSNTNKNLETCGVLAGSLKNRKFYITALIIPKQESTSDSCQTTHEEEIFEVQDKQSLFPLGWIHFIRKSQNLVGPDLTATLEPHYDPRNDTIRCGSFPTHPTQSCFMSSIDVHTHYSYQVMLPEAIAIVMAPRDSSRTHGIFRLTSGGMTVIRQCPRRGFHPHDPPSDGSPIYRHCTDIYMNPSLNFDVIDLR